MISSKNFFYDILLVHSASTYNILSSNIIIFDLSYPRY